MALGRTAGPAGDRARRMSSYGVAGLIVSSAEGTVPRCPVSMVGEATEMMSTCVTAVGVAAR